MNLNQIKKINYINPLNLDKNFLSKSNDLGQTKHYPPTNKEWFNNIYSYNKNYTKSLPITDKVINKLFKSYFNLTSSLENYKIKSKNMRIRSKRLSANKIYLSRAEMKHNNNKVIITIYTYNRTSICNGLTIIRKKTWIKKNISILKKSFYSGIVNFSRKVLFSKIFINLINPFDSLDKKINKKIRQKNRQLYFLELFENLLIKNIVNYLAINKSNLNKFRFFTKSNIIYFIKFKLIIILITLKNEIKNYELIIKKWFYSWNFFNLNKLQINNTFNSINNNYNSMLSIKNITINYKFTIYKLKILINNYINNIFKQKLYKFNLINFKNNVKYFDFEKLIVNKNFYKKNYYFNDFNKHLYIIKNKSSFITNNLKERSDLDLIKFKFLKNLNVNNLNKLNPFDYFSTVKLKKLNSIFNLLNIKNSKIAFYFIIQIYKKYKFLTYKREILSIKNLIELKIDSKRLSKRIKFINNVKNRLQVHFKSFYKLDNHFFSKEKNKLEKNTNIDLFSLPLKEKNILITESNNILKKKLDLVIPLYIYYVQMIYINKFKYKNWFLLELKNILQTIYKKKVEFNIINLKYIHLNSDIISESMAIKLKNRKNRILKVLHKVLKLTKISSFFLKDNLTKLYFNKYKTLKINPYLVQKRVNIIKILNSFKNNKISGIRLEAAGRLTKRLTASRSLFKLKHKGTLKNIDSSYKNQSSVLLRGYLRSNLQYSQVNSKTRNGAFGLKTWISSY